MKKGELFGQMKWKCIVFLTLFLVAIAGSLSAQQMKLDRAVARTAAALEGVLPQRARVAVLNFTSPTTAFSRYVIEELTGELVTGNKLTIVDRQNLELITQEMKLQLSGEVSDASAQAIGKKLGAQSIISGSLSNMGTYYRFRIKAINVETAAIQTQVSYDIQNDEQVAFLLNGTVPAGAGDSGASQGSTARPPSPAPSPVATPVNPGSGARTAPASGAVVVPGASLAAKLQWIAENADNNKEYHVEVSANETLGAQTLVYSYKRNVTVRLIGSGGERTLSPRSADKPLFTIESNVTLIIDRGVTLKGHSSNGATLVLVNNRGMLILNEGGKIIGNTNKEYGGGGVYVNQGGNFDMRGGEISGHTAQNGGGVYVKTTGNFTMSGGVIDGNKSSYGSGGGVYVDGTFTMKGGEISGNTAQSGGGVYVTDGMFTMSGGEIYGNIAYGGGGVYLYQKVTFRMTGGTISGNAAPNDASGGGVHLYVYGNNNFTKTGGTLYGASGDRNDNRAGNGGNAVGGSRTRNSTAGPNVELDSASSGAAGGWE